MWHGKNQLFRPDLNLFVICFFFINQGWEESNFDFKCLARVCEWNFGLIQAWVICFLCRLVFLFLVWRSGPMSGWDGTRVSSIRLIKSACLCIEYGYFILNFFLDLVLIFNAFYAFKLPGKFNMNERRVKMKGWTVWFNCRSCFVQHSWWLYSGICASQGGRFQHWPCFLVNFKL